MNYVLDIHTHTVASGHAFSTFEEMVEGANKKGISILGISDHGPQMPQGANTFYFENLYLLPRKIGSLTILRGAEANIINYEGCLDLSNELLSELDYTIASMHPPCISFGTKSKNTKAIINAIKNPNVKIIGHPDDERYELDFEEICKAAQYYNTLIEINNASLNPRGHRIGAEKTVIKILELSIKYKLPIILSSDAHISYHIADFSLCEKLLEQMSFPLNLIINYSYNDLQKYININDEIGYI